MDDLELRTRVARAGLEEHRFFGHAVFGELVGRVSMTALFSLSVTGKLPDTETERVLDEIAATLTVADPRIWPLKVARIASSFGQGTVGWCLGALAQDRAFIGGESIRNPAEWLIGVEAELSRGRSADEMVRTWKKEGIKLPGVGVPVRTKDERVVCLRRRMTALGREKLAYWRTLELIAEPLRSRRMELNIGSGVAAALLDCGFSPVDIGHLGSLLPLHAFVANAVEGAAQAPAILRRLPPEHVLYEGPPPRESPRQTARGAPPGD